MHIGGRPISRSRDLHTTCVRLIKAEFCFHAHTRLTLEPGPLPVNFHAGPGTNHGKHPKGRYLRFLKAGRVEVNVKYSNCFILSKFCLSLETHIVKIEIIH